MGACGSSDQGGTFQPTMEEVDRSRAIEKMLREEERKAAKEIKILLLGPGSSGKSTILKQMKVIHLSGFTPSEIEAYRQQIFVNLRDGILALCAIMDEFRIDPADPSLRSIRSTVENTPDIREQQAFPPDLYFPIRCFWRDPSTQLAVSKATEATLPENLTYFINDLERLFHPSYRPTDQDVLRCRQKTIGITETIFDSRNLQYRIFDVAAVSGYDQVLLEDPDSNQMQEALMLFDSICNSQWFVKTSIILFLNKVDVLTERILTSPVRNHFPDYQGHDLDHNAVKDFFREKFVRLNRSTSKEVYCHYTTAIDTTLIKVVMTSVYDIILSRNLEGILL